MGDNVVGIGVGEVVVGNGVGDADDGAFVGGGDVGGIVVGDAVVGGRVTVVEKDVGGSETVGCATAAFAVIASATNAATTAHAVFVGVFIVSPFLRPAPSAKEFKGVWWFRSSRWALTGAQVERTEQSCGACMPRLHAQLGSTTALCGRDGAHGRLPASLFRFTGAGVPQCGTHSPNSSGVTRTRTAVNSRYGQYEEAG